MIHNPADEGHQSGLESRRASCRKKLQVVVAQVYYPEPPHTVISKQYTIYNCALVLHCAYEMDKQVEPISSLLLLSNRGRFDLSQQPQKHHLQNIELWKVDCSLRITDQSVKMVLHITYLGICLPIIVRFLDLSNKWTFWKKK